MRPDAYAALRDENGDNSHPELRDEETKFKPWKIYPSPPPPHWHWTDKPQAQLDPTGNEGDGFEFSKCDIPGADSWVYKIDNKGVFQIYATEPQEEEGYGILHINIHITDEEIDVGQETETKPLFFVPTIKDYYVDLDYLLGVIADGPTKSFAYRRLKYLQGKWGMYTLLNEHQELMDMKVCSISNSRLHWFSDSSKGVPHRDFYNVRKVDTHVHHSSSMNQKHLLRFIKSKMKRSPDVCVHCFPLMSSLTFTYRTSSSFETAKNSRLPKSLNLSA